MDGSNQQIDVIDIVKKYENIIGLCVSTGNRAEKILLVSQNEETVITNVNDFQVTNIHYVFKKSQKINFLTEK